jgi:bacterioferritin-associated ferredoxin
MAILLSNLKLSSGLITTGVGALGCQHELWQPQCMVNLQKGERYGSFVRSRCGLQYLPQYRQCNMQLSLFKSLHTMNRAVDVVHSYNINCQFAVHLMERFDTLLDDIKEVEKLAIKFVHVIPKLHIMGHMRLCQMCYSLNFHAGCGRFCGECIERMWSIMNGITLSTREMRPGCRADWIDFHMGHHNWMKQCSIGT